MDSVLDFLFLRRLKFEYTSPPICPITPASGSSFGVTGQVISPILAMNAPTLVGNFLTWPCGDNAICFNIYFVNGGLLTEVATCIQPNTVLVCSAGCWQASAVINGIEGPLTAPICTDGTHSVAIPLPAASGVQQYRLYKDSVLVLASTFCAAFETCTLGCYSVSAITGDGETPPSPSTCNGGDPTISITAPANGSTFDMPVSTPFTAAVTLNGHTGNKVDFYANSILIGTVTGSGPYSITWSPSTIGNYTLEAVLTYDGTMTKTAAPVNVTVEVVIPAINDLLQQTESFDFDATPNGTAVATWLDKTPNHNNWGMSATAPTVDGTVLAGGHKTLRFNGFPTDNGMQSSGIFIPGGLTGMELMVVYKTDNNNPNFPSDTGNPVITYQVTMNEGGGTVGTGAIQGVNPAAAGCGGPGPFYLETFCIDNTLAAEATCGPFTNLGTPVTDSSAGFVCYNLSAKSGGPYKAWINDENFYSNNAGLTFLTHGVEIFYTIGWELNTNGSATFLAGNIAAVYLWKRTLTDPERAQMRTYINQTWGVTI